jgi:hypothetical protein
MDYVMSASSSPPPPAHRIAVLLSAEGRFLQYRDCNLTFQFPDGAHFNTVAKQFEPHLCSSASVDGDQEAKMWRDAV